MHHQIGRRGEENDNIFLSTFLYLERDTLKQVELYNATGYPYLILMVLLLGNRLMMQKWLFSISVSVTSTGRLSLITKLRLK